MAFHFQAGIRVPQKITYEQPLNERMRTLLRLEFLFLQARHSMQGGLVWDNRATLASILDILNVCGRSDLKSEVLKELERHSASLARLENAPGVDLTALGRILDELEGAIDRFNATPGQPGQSLRQNEFLNSIKQRSGIPGGLCEFDLPAYHYWLQQSPDTRMADLQEWLGALDVLGQSVALILRLMRGCNVPTREHAEGGFFQKSLDVENPACQLVRASIATDLPYFVEISGGKHRVSVRFMDPVTGGRAVQTTADVEFDLTCCTI